MFVLRGPMRPEHRPDRSGRVRYRSGIPRTVSPTRSMPLTWRTHTAIAWHESRCRVGVPEIQSTIPTENGMIPEMSAKRGWNTTGGKVELCRTIEMNVARRGGTGRRARVRAWTGSRGGGTNQWYPDLMYEPPGGPAARRRMAY